MTASSTALALNQSPWLELHDLLDLAGREVAKGARRLDLAEVIARAFLDDVGDDEVAAVRRQLGQRRDDAEVGVALGQVEGAQLLLVGGKPVGVVGVVGLEEAQGPARLLRVHLLAEAAVAETSCCR